jgi:hypothetical protein
MSLPICTSDVSLMITRFQTLKPLYSKVSSPDANNPAIELKDNTAECQKQLDAVIHEISGLKTVMDSINDLHQQLAEKKDKMTQFVNSYKRLVTALWCFPTEIYPTFHVLSP